jgi:hypothetical protein
MAHFVQPYTGVQKHCGYSLHSSEYPEGRGRPSFPFVYACWLAFPSLSPPQPASSTAAANYGAEKERQKREAQMEKEADAVLDSVLASVVTAFSSLKK